MSEGIRGNRPPRPPTAAPRGAAVNRALPHEISDSKSGPVQEAAPGEKASALDVFEGGGNARPQVKQELAAITTQRSLAGVNFTDQELAKLAGQLMVVFKRNPKATSRAARAKLATGAILRGPGSGKLGKILEKLDEQETEEMESDIASMIAESPRLGEWLDSISEEASRT